MPWFIAKHSRFDIYLRLSSNLNSFLRPDCHVTTLRFSLAKRTWFDVAEVLLALDEGAAVRVQVAVLHPARRTLLARFVSVVQGNEQSSQKFHTDK